MTTDENGSSSQAHSLTDAEIVTLEQTSSWDEAISFVDAECRFLCHSWIPLLKQTYGYAPELVVLKANAEVVGVLPYVVVKSPFTGTRAISLPFFDICRPFTKEPNFHRLLYNAFKAEGKKRGWDYIELRGNIDQLGDLQPSLRFYNHIVDLSQGAQSVFDNFHSSARRAVRKAQKSGVEIRFSNDLDTLKHFYRLQCLTRKRHGLPPQPYTFFKNLHRELLSNEKGVIVTASIDGQITAASIYLQQGKTVHYKYGASDVRFQSSRCNNLVMWSAMEYYANKGATQMDLGRNSLKNQGLRRYKCSWGSIEHITSYIRVDLSTDSIIPMSDDVYGWHNQLFKNLPIPLNKIIGNLLYKHIA